MWHLIFEAVPKDRPVTLAVLDEDGFHALEFRAASNVLVCSDKIARLGQGSMRGPCLRGGDKQLDFVEMAPR